MENLQNDRKPGCHDNCTKYKEYTKEVEDAKKEWHRVRDGRKPKRYGT